jgi:transcription elongation factor
LTNGVFVEKTRNVVILGDEHIDNNQDGAGMNRRLKDKLQDKIVMIMKGEWKGFRGLVKHCDDKQATVEITSQKAKKIHINKDLLQLWDVN